ncbi:co-regulatory protein PtrA N-terminal domain-containing protein [Pseudomonas protegens]|uniref:co-regulatory protein PtrA N-terminal domain-containing protein n=1 Tax=Pseudomonas protegens TaxID=380021 RepID=UPI0011CE3A18|nr:co-regulatory protein PtrA N-terminal domain-containing protein [Pseudomonas protegens]
MKEIIVAFTLFLSALSSLAFAEGGADRLQEKNEILVQEAKAAQAEAKSDTQKTTKSDEEANSESN